MNETLKDRPDESLPRPADLPIFSAPPAIHFRPRAPGLALSILLHLVWIACLPFITQQALELDRILQQDIHEEIERQSRKKLTWFRVQTLPPVQPSNRQPARQTARGRVRSEVEVVVERKKAPDGRQLIYRERPKERPQDTPSPNMVIATAPPPPVVPKAEPKTMELEAPPALSAKQDAPASPAAATQIARLAKPKPKAYIPPKSTADAIPSTTSIEFGEIPVSDASKIPDSPLDSLNRNALAGGEKIAKLPPRKYQAPAGGKRTGGGNPSQLEAPVALHAGEGNPGVNVAVLGLDPKLAPPPASGTRTTQFSQGREVGAPAHVRNDNPGAARLPGVSTNTPVGASPGIRRPLPPGELSNNAQREDNFTVEMDLRKRWPRISIPLAPSSRILPRRIEPLFVGRNVYTMVIPIEKLDRYTGDWILWFAEVDSNPTGRNQRVEPPIPSWKLESRRWLVSKGEAEAEQRVQLVARIGADGKVDVKNMVQRMGAPLDELFFNDLSRWVFSPARRDGIPIAVDAVFELPFRIPASLQVSTR